MESGSQAPSKPEKEVGIILREYAQFVIDFSQDYDAFHKGLKAGLETYLVNGQVALNDARGVFAAQYSGFANSAMTAATNAANAGSSAEAGYWTNIANHYSGRASALMD
ncbi:MULTISPECIES: hypothetical protein [Xanthomonas]|uniref:Phasin domain-containing protein n=1 Tax=Xanthomonas dyei TaxID=743699 RepID=A0ABZ0D6B2_9XANT|nr:hypothetical protein [Xanthomonas dyei]WOB25661.1 hypothetical protein NYR99_18425 [Xanthomonas dyei]WOB53287.1 hypothetical protein NYR95_18430 [Xanthomonas dyei]